MNKSGAGFLHVSRRKRARVGPHVDRARGAKGDLLKTDKMTDTTENITFPQSVAGGKN